jgi:hypothetical protein
VSGADVAAAMMLCQSYFAGFSAMCDAIAGGRCHFQWTVPECFQVESQYYAPGGPADQAASNSSLAAAKAREELRTLLSRP